jgi:hypothetical protein
MSNVSIRIIERAIESAENPSGMSTHDGMARVPACHLRRLLAELAEARLERHRLREALEKIASDRYNFRDFCDIARAALEDKP